METNDIARRFNAIQADLPANPIVDELQDCFEAAMNRIAALEAQLADRDSEIERLRAERDDLLAEVDVLEGANRHLTKERDRARELAVWVAKTGGRLALRGNSVSLYHGLRWGSEIDHDGTDAGIYAALEEAMGRE